MLERVESVLNEIRIKLLNDEIVRRLLVNDNTNCLSAKSAPTKQETENYITLFPIYQFENKEMYEQNGFVNIVLESAQDNGTDLTISGVLQINVVFNIDRWTIEGNKIRPISLANRIIKLLKNEKLSISNPITFDSMQELIINKKVVGYALLFNLEDGNSNLENF